jgi:fatty acid desaturase
VWWNFVSGGLNHQIEHHMFPSMHHYLYPHISPIVQQTCEEFGIPFGNFETLPQAWWSMIKYLHRLGHYDDPSEAATKKID